MITFALNEQEEKVDISESVRGEPYQCFFCKEKMIPKLGNSVAHHFSHKENSCRNSEGYLKTTFLLYPYFSQSLTGPKLIALKAIWMYYKEGFVIRKGGQGSAHQLMYQAGVGNLNATFDALVEEGFITDVSDYTTEPIHKPGPQTVVQQALTNDGEKVWLVTTYGQNHWYTDANFYKQVVKEKYRISPKGKAVFCELSLAQFCNWQFGELTIEKVKDVALLNQLIQDINGLHLYLIKLTFQGLKVPVFKIGCTYRDPQVRVAEILAELKQYGKLKAHKVLFSLAGKGLIEFYFKKKYLLNRYTNPQLGITEDKTEYFCFDTLLHNQVILQLKEVKKIKNQFKTLTTTKV